MCTYWFFSFLQPQHQQKKGKQQHPKSSHEKTFPADEKYSITQKKLLSWKIILPILFGLFFKRLLDKVFSKEVKLAAMVISHGSNVLLPPSFFIYVDLRTVLCYHNGMTFDYYFGGGKCIGKYFYFAMPASCRLLSRLCKELHATTSSRGFHFYVKLHPVTGRNCILFRIFWGFQIWPPFWPQRSPKSSEKIWSSDLFEAKFS